MTILYHAASDLATSGSTDITELLRDFQKNGDETGLVALLLTHLPQLSKLEWQARTSETASNAILDHILSLPKAGAEHLPALREVQYHGCYRRVDNSYIRMFAALPSMEHISGDNLSLSRHHNVSIAPQSSSMTQLELNYSETSPALARKPRLRDLLLCSRNLEAFTLQYSVGFFLYSDAVIKALYRYAGTTLKHLTVRSYGMPSTSLPDLRRFVNLISLKTDLCLLFDDGNDLERSMRALPPSLKELSCHENGRQDNNEDLESLRTMIEKKKQGLMPQLSGINLSVSYRLAFYERVHAREKLAALEITCHELGVECQITTSEDPRMCI